MTREGRGPVPRLRLGLLQWLAGMLGMVVLMVTVLPLLLRGVTLPVPLWVVSLASTAQSAVLLALAVWAGVALAPAVSLHAPAFEAAVTDRRLGPALGPQILPGLVAGVLGGISLFALARVAPDELAGLQERFNPPLFARILYGGITEELLLRWGLMTALVWLAWRLLRRGSGAPPPIYVWLAIVASALLFGVGHLPAARAALGALSGDVVGFVIGANTAFGIVFGFLFWRYGLEAAMIAHGGAHAVSYFMGLF